MKSNKILFLFFLVILVSSVSAVRQVEKISQVVSAKAQSGEVDVLVKMKNSDARFPFRERFKKIDSDLYQAELSQEEISLLAQNELVERVDYNFQVQAFLQESVPLIGAPNIWTTDFQNVGFTGKNTSVCVIDTGVNYNHPDLGGCFGINNISSNCKVIGGWNVHTDDSNIMDDEGHGTHVAGIIAANGGIKGVAPDAKIVALKALNSTGGGNSGHIISSINWCVNHSQEFNIVAITMSLGTTTLYSNYCDSDSGNFNMKNAINSAIAKNISVIAATGNDGNSTAIASPSCIQNVTAVSSTTKSDAIAFYSNYNTITDLFAPGGSSSNPITSTSISGGYVGELGTSMAAPHVAGAIALLREFSKYNNLQLTPNQLESQLKSNGKPIISINGANLTRIDVYKTALALDSIPPDVTLSGVNVSYEKNVNLSCSAQDFSIKNATFFLWKNNTLIFNQSNENLTQLNVSLTNLTLSNYEWNCLFTDESNNHAFASKNASLSINGIFTQLLSPQNNFFTNQTNLSFQCGFETNPNLKLKNVTFFLWNSTNLTFTQTKTLSGSQNQSSFQLNLSEGGYQWNCLAFNNVSESSLSANNFSLTIDTISPNLTLISPANESTFTSLDIILFEFQFNNSENLNYCNLIANNQTLGNTTNTSLSLSLSPNTYIWNLECFDLAGNVGISESRFMTINSPPSPVSSPSGGGGGGGGGGGSSGGSPRRIPLNSTNSTNNSLTTLSSPNIREIEASSDWDEVSEETPQETDVNTPSGFAVSSANFFKKLSSRKLIFSYAVFALIFITGFLLFRKHRRTRIQNNFFYNSSFE